MSEDLFSGNFSLTNQTAFVPRINKPITYSFLLLLFVPAVTLFGNSLVVLSVIRERSLRNATNWFLVSLATADIILAALVMPVATWIEMTSGHWMFGDILCNIFLMLDVLFCTASILNLVAISLDRYLAVTRPISYAKRDNIRRIQLSIATVWIVSLIISLPIVCGLNTVNSYDPTMCQSRNAVYIVTSSIGSFYLPAVVLIVLYHRIFAVIRQRHKMLEQTTGKRLYSGSGTTEWLGDLSQSVCLGLYTAPDENNASPKPGTNLTFPPVEPNECGARDSVQITSNPYTMRRLSEIELFDKTVQAAERLYPNPNGHSNKSPAKHRSSHLNQSLSLPELFFQGESVSRLYPTKNSTIKSKSVDLLFFKPPVNSSRLSSSTLNQRSKCSSVCNSPGSKCDLKHPSGTHSQFASAVLSHTSSESLGNTFDSTVHVYTNHCVASSEHMHCTHIQPGECPCPYHVCCYEYSCVSTEKESTRGKRMSYRKRPATNSVNCCFRAPISSDDSSPVFSGPNISDLLAFSFSDMSNGEFDTSTLRQYESSRSDYIHCECCCPATCQAIKPIERWSGEFTAGTNQIRRNKSAQKRMLMQQRQDYKDAKSNPGLSPWNRMLALQIPLKRKLVSDNMPKTDRKYDPIMSINQEREWARCVRISESGNKDYSKSRKRSASVSRRANLDTVFINFQTFWKQAAEKNTRQTTQTESGGSFQNTYIKTETIPDGEQNSGGKVKDSGSRTARYAKFWVSKQRSLSNREKKAMKTLVIVLAAFLICWVPFFTVNVGIGICRLRNATHHPACVIFDQLMSACTWLGYVNSLLNPMIYTIFNLEFRMAFKKLLGIK